MTTQTQTLADFLLDRIAEDEAVARACALAGPVPSGDWWAEGSWWLEGVEMLPVGKGDGGMDIVAYCYADDNRAHVARHDPARVLAECAAKRAIVEMAVEATGLDIQVDSEFAVEPRDTAADPYLGDRILRHLASVYADHPDYRDEWRT